MTVVFVHGSPETAELWDPLRAVLSRDAVALSLPGFGAPRPHPDRAATGQCGATTS